MPKSNATKIKPSTSDDAGLLTLHTSIHWTMSGRSLAVYHSSPYMHQHTGRCMVDHWLFTTPHPTYINTLDDVWSITGCLPLLTLHASTHWTMYGRSLAVYHSSPYIHQHTGRCMVDHWLFTTPHPTYINTLDDVWSITGCLPLLTLHTSTQWTMSGRSLAVYHSSPYIHQHTGGCLVDHWLFTTGKIFKLR